MDKIQYIKTYSADTISKFTNSQIQTIIDHFTKKPGVEFTDDQDSSSDDLFETEVSIPTESIPLDLSQENNQDLELPEDEVNASTEETKSRVSDSSISANNPEEKRKHVIKMVLERFTNLSFKRSSKYTDHFNCTETCPVCNEEHKDDNVSGEWGSGDYYGEETYRLYCRKVYQNRIQVATVKKENIKEKRRVLINKVLKQYPGISLSCSTNSNDIYHCNTSKSSCPSCNLNHKENIVGQYERGSYNIRCMFNYTGGIDVTA